MTKVLSQYKYYWSKQTIDGSKVNKVPIRYKDFLQFNFNLCTVNVRAVLQVELLLIELMPNK